MANCFVLRYSIRQSVPFRIACGRPDDVRLGATSWNPGAGWALTVEGLPISLAIIKRAWDNRTQYSVGNATKKWARTAYYCFYKQYFSAKTEPDNTPRFMWWTRTCFIRILERGGSWHGASAVGAKVHDCRGTTPHFSAGVIRLRWKPSLETTRGRRQKRE